jgi:hypothetical protein
VKGRGGVGAEERRGGAEERGVGQRATMIGGAGGDMEMGEG